MPRKVYKEERKVWDKRYRDANKEKIADRNKKYQQNNIEKIKKQNQNYYQANKEKIKIKTKTYAKVNAKKVLKWKRESAKRHPETARIGKRQRRAREKSVLSEKYTTQQVLNAYGTNCHICGKPINLKAPRQTGKPGWRHALHIDHVIPISKGGPDTLANVRPAHGLCNVRKWARVK